MNSTNHIGRLTSDPELRRTGDGTAVCTFTLAVKRPRQKDTSDFIDFVVWRQGAEYLCQYGHKGDIVAVSGALQSRKWTDKNGNNRIAWEVNAESIELLSSKKDSQECGNTTKNQNSYQGGNSYAQPKYSQQNFQQIDDPDVSLPF